MNTLVMDPFIVRHDDSDWMALEPLADEGFLHWQGWRDFDNEAAASVVFNNDAAASVDLSTPLHNSHSAASEISRPTSPPVALSHPAPVLLPVAPIAEDFVCLFEVTPPTAPAATNRACYTTSKDGKRLRPKELTEALRSWMERRQTKPYATLEEKKLVAGALEISVEQVTNFCNNFRKRFVKVGDKLTSYRELVSAAP
jgi:hypothetical protein